MPRISRIARISLNVRDLDRMVGFYVEALGFVASDMGQGSAQLTLGGQAIELLARSDAAPYPMPRAANDPWFQHFAIAVADMDAAYARLSRYDHEPISIGGPQLLPPSTGSVTAYKFRDPEGHPLELSFAPGSAWTAGAIPGALFLGIDHTALATRDLDASIAFYTGLGCRVGVRLLNQGPEQARLDGLNGATLDIVTLLTPAAGPHIELLHYHNPVPSPAHVIAADNLAATRTVFVSGDVTDGSRARKFVESMDPDGHLLRFTA